MKLSQMSMERIAARFIRKRTCEKYNNNNDRAINRLCNDLTWISFSIAEIHQILEFRVEFILAFLIRRLIFERMPVAQVLPNVQPVRLNRDLEPLCIKFFCIFSENRPQLLYMQGLH